MSDSRRGRVILRVARASNQRFSPVSSASRTGLELLSRAVSGLLCQLDSWHSDGAARCSFARRVRGARRGLERCGVVMKLPMEVETDLMAVLETQKNRVNALASRRDD